MTAVRVVLALVGAAMWAFWLFHSFQAVALEGRAALEDRSVLARYALQ